MRARIYTAKLKFWGKITFMKDSRWAKMTIKDSIETGWDCVWMNEIVSIRSELGLMDMCGIRTYKQWCTRVEKAISKWEESKFISAKAEKKTLIWYSTPFNDRGKIPPYVNGSKEANILFNTKAGSWVLKKNGIN